jgi:hypothetical protein
MSSNRISIARQRNASINARPKLSTPMVARVLSDPLTARMASSTGLRTRPVALTHTRPLCLYSTVCSHPRRTLYLRRRCHRPVLVDFRILPSPASCRSQSCSTTNRMPHLREEIFLCLRLFTTSELARFCHPHLFPRHVMIGPLSARPLAASALATIAARTLSPSFPLPRSRLRIRLS